MRVLLVQAHPDPDAFEGSLRDAAQRGLERAGHEVTVIDLYAEGFDARMSRAERLAYETGSPILDPVVQAHAELVLQAEALVFVYPTWCWGMPAVLKGWLERVLVPGIAFRLDERTNKVKPGLRDLRRVAGITTCESTRRSMLFSGDAGRRIVRRNIPLLAPPLRCRTSWFGHYGSDAATPEERAAFLRRVENGLARW